MKKEQSSEVPVACDLSLFNLRQSKTREALLEELLSSIQLSRELSNGYELILPNDEGRYVKLAEWVSLERLCCPFLSFEQGFGQNVVWLRLTGDKNAKQFLKAMLEAVVRDRLVPKSEKVR
jgi:hypothetical protein